MNETRFKKTDIGEVPEDWDIDSLGNIINVLTDYTANGSFASLAENVTYLDHIDYARLVRLTDLRANFKNNGIYVSKSSYDFLKKSKLHGGEILLANVGAYAGYSFVYPKKMPFVGTLGPNMFLIKLDNNRIQDSYGIYIFIYGCVFDQLLSKATSSAQPKLNKDNVRECLFSCPKDKKEQQRIATVLSDIDVLLSTLNKKIEKKKLIKQGVMQQLLTGKKRLAGFTEPWREKRLGELCQLFGRIGFRGYTKADLVRKGEGAITFSPSDIHDNQLDYTNCTYISMFKYEESPEIKVYSGDIIFCKTASIGKCAIVKELNEKATINPQFVVMKNFVCSNVFLYYKLVEREFQERVKEITGGSTIPTMSQEKLKEQVLLMPTLSEQTVIAAILSDMDKEIEILEAKRTKYEQVKQGMMQQLLTGKIRLID